MHNLRRSALAEFDPFVDTGLVPSPCINVCQMNAHSGLCEGCLRTIEEIMQWGTASESAKRAMWVEIRQRQVELEAELKSADLPNGEAR